MKKLVLVSSLLVSSISFAATETVFDCFIKDPKPALTKTFKKVGVLGDLSIVSTADENGSLDYMINLGERPLTKDKEPRVIREDRTAYFNDNKEYKTEYAIFSYNSELAKRSFELNLRKTSYSGYWEGELSSITSKKDGDALVTSTTTYADDVVCKKGAFEGNERVLTKLAAVVSVGNGSADVSPVAKNPVTYKQFKKDAESSEGCTRVATNLKKDVLAELKKESTDVNGVEVADLVKDLDVEEAFMSNWAGETENEEAISCTVREYVIRTKDGYELSLTVDETD